MSELKMPYLSEYEKSCIDKSGGYWIPSNNCPSYLFHDLKEKLKIINEIRRRESIRKEWGNADEGITVWGKQ